MTRLQVFIILGITLLVAPHVVAADSEPPQQVILKITFSEISPRDDVNKVLAEPTIAVTLGKPFSFHVGGELSGTDGEDAIEIGTRVRGTVDKHDEDSLTVALQLTVGHEVVSARDPDTTLAKAETVDLRTRMMIGREKQFDCGRSQVLKVQAQAIPAPADQSSNELKKPNSEVAFGRD